MKYISCNLCQGDNTSLLFKKDSMQIVKCLDCGLIYVNPRHLEEDLKKIYKNGYFNGSEQTNFFAEKGLYISRFQERLREISRFKKEGRLLDIGCAMGYFLEVAKEKGWQTYGVEISAFASQYASDSGSNVFTGTLEEAEYPGQSFDMITLWHVLEHMPDPLGCLQKIQRLLKRTGLIAIEVPNIGSRRSKRLREKWDQLKPQEHLYYFTPDVLRKMVKKAGFKIVKIKTIPGGTGLGNKLEHLKFAKFKKQLIGLFKYLQWIKKCIIYFKRIGGADDIILLYALKL